MVSCCSCYAPRSNLTVHSSVAPSLRHLFPLNPGPHGNFEQKSIGEFLESASARDPNLKTMRNPLAREFGVRDAADAEYFVQTVLPTYKLVSNSVQDRNSS